MEKTTGESTEGDEPESSISIFRSKNMVKYSLLYMLTLKLLFKKTNTPSFFELSTFETPIYMPGLPIV